MSTKTTQGKERYRLKLSEANNIIVSEYQEKAKKKDKDTWFYLGFVGEIGFAIALPVAGGALIGVYIDRHLSIYPKATLLLLFIGFIISILGFIRTIQILMSRKN